MVQIMSKKKVFLLLISLVFMSLFSNFVFAQIQPEEGLGGAFDTIRELFEFLPEIVTLEKLIGEEPAALFWAKFLVWLLLFAAIYFGAGFVFKENQRIQVIVSIVISLMGTLLIPVSILINIFQTYGLVAGVIVWSIPLVAGMVIAHKIQIPFVRAIIFGLATWVLISINETVVKEQGLGNTTFPFFGILLAVVIILFVISAAQTLGMIGGGEGGRGIGGWFGDQGRRIGDILGRRDRDDIGSSLSARDAERAHEERAADAEKLNEKLSELERELNSELRRVEGNEIEIVRILAEQLKKLVEILEELRSERRSR